MSNDFKTDRNNLPMISIITPSFNQGHYIEETIKSIISQHYPNLEYIIIDGGSTDKTLSIIDKYKDHIYYWVSIPFTSLISHIFIIFIDN